jgi:histidine triad (HIT) family protein
MSIFTKIISGEIPSFKIAENENFYAFLDINPNAKGHTLVVPKKEVDKLFVLDKETYLKLFEFSRKVAIAIEKAIPCKRVGLSVIGLEVPHVHVHLIPLNSMDDIRFDKKEKISNQEMQDIANLVASKI